MRQGSFGVRSRRQAASLFALSVALLSPSLAYAQGSSGNQQRQGGSTGGQTAASADEDTITVTARRREENLQEVPLTVTAVSGEQLQDQNVVSPQDLQFIAPSLTVQAQLGRTGGSYTVRSLNAGVVTYFSEAPGGPTAIGHPFFDTQSVQVLNGPQGTLFGRSAAAGAVLVTPQHPDLNSLGGYLDVSTGNYGRLQATGVLNVPIIEGELAVRAVYHRDHIDGFTRQIQPARIIDGLPGQINLDERLDEVNSNSFRVSIEGRSGNFRNYAVYNYLEIDQTGPGQILSYANPTLATLNNAPAAFNTICTAAVNNRLEASVAACTARRAAAMAAVRETIVAEFARIQAGGSVRETPALQGEVSVDRVIQRTAVDIAEYDFGDLGFTTLRAKNVFSYQEDQGVSSYSLDGVGGISLAVVSATGRPLAPIASVNQTGNSVAPQLGDPIKTLTEEFQLQGTVADMVQWTAGFYYQRRRDPTDRFNVGGFARSFAGLLAQNQGWAATFQFANGSTSRESAGYGQVTIDLDRVGVHGLSLTGGIRSTSSVITTRQIQSVANPAGTGPVLQGAVLPDIVSRFSGINYTLGVTEQITPDIMIYATHSRSFVPGGQNTTVGCNIAPGCRDVFDPSVVRNYEAGIRTEFRAGNARVRLNASAYRLDFDNIQQTFRFTSGTTNIIYQGNVAAARMQGFEIMADLAVRNLSLSASYSFNDAEFTDWVAPDLNNVRLTTDVCLPPSAGTLCLIDLSGSPFQNAPRHQLRGSIRYELPLANDDGEVSIALNGYYQSRQWHVAAAFRELEVAANRGLGDVTEAISQDAYGVLNARVGWDRIMGSRFSASLFVNNLTDTTFSQAGSTRSYSTGTTVRLYAPPRMWGVSVRFEFGEQ